MSTKSIAAVAAAVGALAFASAADAKPKHKDRVWDPVHGRYVERTWTPPGLAKKPGGMPPGQYKKMHQYNVGAHLPRSYYVNRNYYVTDYDRYQLRAAPPGYRWVRVGDDVYLAQTRTGLIAEVIADLFN